MPGWSSARAVRPERKEVEQRAVDTEDEMRWERMEKLGG
jgi:hypothetical protein